MVDGDHNASMAEDPPTQQSLLDVLASSGWCLDREKLVQSFGQSGLYYRFLESLSKLSNDFAQSHSWKFVYDLLLNAMLDRHMMTSNPLPGYRSGDVKRVNWLLGEGKMEKSILPNSWYQDICADIIESGREKQDTKRSNKGRKRKQSDSGDLDTPYKPPMVAKKGRPNVILRSAGEELAPPQDVHRESSADHSNGAFSLSPDEVSETHVNTDLTPARGHTPSPHCRDDRSTPTPETSKHIDTTEMCSPVIEPRKSDNASAPGMVASAQMQQHVLDQLASSNRLDGSALETVLSWLLPRFRHLTTDTPPSWTSFSLSPDWRTNVSDSRDLLVVLQRPLYHHWTLLYIRLDEAKVVAYDPLRTDDSALEEASEAIVAAMDLDWIRDGWSFTTAQCPQQQNDQDAGIFVLLYAMHLSVEMTLPSSAVVDSDLWRMLFTILVRKSPLTVEETSSYPSLNTAAPATPENLSSCQQLLRLYSKMSGKLESSKSKQLSLGHAKCLLTSFSRFCASLDADTTPLAARLASNREFLREVRSRNPTGNLHDEQLIETLHQTNVRLEAELHSHQVGAAKVPDLAFLLEQIDALILELNNTHSACVRMARELMSEAESENAKMSAFLEDVDMTDAE